MTQLSRVAGLPARPVRALAVAAALGLGLGLSGCSATNPTLVETYAAADGINGSIADDTIVLRNVLLVTSGKDAAGTLYGVVSTRGSQSVPVTFSVLNADGSAIGANSPIRVTPGMPVQLGTTGNTITVPSVPVIPGSTLQLQVDSPLGGERLTLPVVLKQGHYASWTPEAVSG